MTPSDRARRRGAPRSGGARSAASRPGNRPTLAERRVVARERRHAELRRRGFGVFAALVLVGAGVAACSTIVHRDHHGGTTAASGTSGTGGTGGSSTTRPKKPTLQPGSFHVGITTFSWDDATGETVSPTTGDDVSGAKLTTEVRYPTDRGSASAETTNAKPAASGPFPVVLFAHGFDVSPSYYQSLLDSWVREGFVVVSPVFPDENTNEVVSVGGPDSNDGVRAEGDVVNEPADLVYVMKQFQAAAATGSGTILAGVADTSDYVLTGQSDGANVVAALAYDSSFASELAQLSPPPKGVAILSGQSIGEGTPAATSTSPPVLQVQSDSDTCNLTANASDLFNDLLSAPLHLFVYLHGAQHLWPYTTPGHEPWSTIVQKTTTQFFQYELRWHAGGISVSTISATATSSQSQVFQSELTAANLGSPASSGSCVGQLPTTAPSSSSGGSTTVSSSTTAAGG